MPTDLEKQSQVSIVGGGAVGKMLAFFLQSVGIAPVVHGRGGPAIVLQKVLIHGKTLSLGTTLGSSAPDLWLFATKAYDLQSALLQQLPHIDPSVPVVLLANGFIEPSLTAIRQQFPQHALTKGVVSRGARTLVDGTLAVSDQGEIIWGGSQTPTGFEQNLFQKLGKEGFSWRPEACRLRKEKWFCNTVLNTLCGAYRLPRNGDAELLPEFPGLCREVFLLGLSYWPEWQGQEDQLVTLLLNLIAKTRENENSMAVDVRLGRRTEADFLSGHIERFADSKTRFPLLAGLHGRILASDSEARR